MKLHELGPLFGSKHKKKRIGRGESSGQGKTAGRGHKGQKARSGGGTRPGFEGGQMPLQRRLPKKGFTNIFKKEFSLIKIADLNCFPEEAVVNDVALLGSGLVKNINKPIKLLGDGTLLKLRLVVKVQAASVSAVTKVQAAGGRVELNTL
jgi:large subunit ribosomal protein L15